jgi:beta-xylosidase
LAKNGSTGIPAHETRRILAATARVGGRTGTRMCSALAVGLLLSLVIAPTETSAAKRATWDPIRVAPVRLAHPAVLITPGINVPNPYVMHLAGRYYMFASQESLYKPVTLLVSRSLTHWRPSKLNPLPTVPRWAEPTFTWSPDVRHVGGHYVMWFSAALAGSTSPFPTKCIGFATASSLKGPYRSKERKPMICQLEHFGSIDPRTFVDPKRRLWLLWKSDDNAEFTASTHTTIYTQRLSSNGLHLLGKPIALLTANQPWEGGIIEAPDMIFAGGRYWLFFSANWFNQPSYGIGLAQCAGPAGPCKPSLSGLWLTSNAQGAGPGEETLFFDGSRWWLLYAPYATDHQYQTSRPAVLARLVFGPKGPRVVRPGTKAWDRPVKRVVVHTRRLPFPSRNVYR